MTTHGMQQSRQSQQHDPHGDPQHEFLPPSLVSDFCSTTPDDTPLTVETKEACLGTRDDEAEDECEDAEEQ